MTRSLRLLCANAALAVLANACVSSTNNPTPGDDDSGAFPGVDGSVPGTDATIADDGSVADSGPPQGDAAPQPLTVKVTAGGVPESGIVIVFQDASGAVVSTATTDTTGAVTQMVTSGGQVTAVFGSKANPNLVTIQGVAPGDVLQFTDGALSGSTVNQVAVTPPAPTWDAAGIREEVYAGDCSGQIPQSMYLYSDCSVDGTFPLFLRATDDSGKEIAYTYQKGNAVSPDGGLPDGDTTIPVTVTRGWSTTTASQTIIGTNIPPLPADAGADEAQENVFFAYSEVADGLVLNLPAEMQSPLDGGAQTSVFDVHPGYADVAQSEAYFTLATDFGNIDSVLVGVTRAAAGAPTTASIDFNTLPLITAASVDVSDGGTPVQPAVSWTSGSLSAATGVFVQLQWSSQPGDAGGGYANGLWTILAPPTATRVQAPALPAAVAAWAPAADASYESIPRVGAVQTSIVPGYAGLRGLFGTLSFFPNGGYLLSVPPLPADGTIFVSAIYPNEG